MKKHFTPAQIAFALRQAASGTPISENTRKMGVRSMRRPFFAIGEALEEYFLNFC